MPVTSFNKDAKLPRSGSEFPRLKLEKDEKVRVALLGKPVYRWQHRLMKIALDMGRPVRVTRERRDGSTYEVYDEEFVSLAACTGDDETLHDRQIDPEGCPVCAAARDYPDAFSKPTRRFAAQTFKYATKPGTADVQHPFGGEILVWNFTERRFEELVDIASEFEGLGNNDLILGPCKNATFQNYDIMASPRAEWQQSDESKAFLKSSLQENGFDSEALHNSCVRIAEKRYVLQDIEAVVERYRYVLDFEQGGASQVSGSAGAEAAITAETGADVGAALDDIMSSISTTSDDAPATVNEEPVEEEPSGNSEVIGMSELESLMDL